MNGFCVWSERGESLGILSHINSHEIVRAPKSVSPRVPIGAKVFQM